MATSKKPPSAPKVFVSPGALTAPRLWNRLEGPYRVLPPAANGHISEPVWLALSDGTVREGECLFKGTGSPEPDTWWFIADGKHPHSQVPRTLKVLGWARREPTPLFPNALREL